MTIAYHMTPVSISHFIDGAMGNNVSTTKGDGDSQLVMNASLPANEAGAAAAGH